MNKTKKSTMRKSLMLMFALCSLTHAAMGQDANAGTHQKQSRGKRSPRAGGGSTRLGFCSLAFLFSGNDSLGSRNLFAVRLVAGFLLAVGSDRFGMGCLAMINAIAPSTQTASNQNVSTPLPSCFRSLGCRDIGIRFSMQFLHRRQIARSKFLAIRSPQTTPIYLSS